MKRSQQGRLGKKWEPKITRCFTEENKSPKCLLSLATRRTLNTWSDSFRELVGVDFLCKKKKRRRLGGERTVACQWIQADRQDDSSESIKYKRGLGYYFSEVLSSANSWGEKRLILQRREYTRADRPPGGWLILHITKALSERLKISSGIQNRVSATCLWPFPTIYFS